MKPLALSILLAAAMSMAIVHAQQPPMKSRPSERADRAAQRTVLKNELAGTRLRVKEQLEKVEARLAAAGDEAHPELDDARNRLKQAGGELDQALNAVGTATSDGWEEVMRSANTVNEKARTLLAGFKDEATDAPTPVPPGERR